MARWTWQQGLITWKQLSKLIRNVLFKSLLIVIAEERKQGLKLMAQSNNTASLNELDTLANWHPQEEILHYTVSPYLQVTGNSKTFKTGRNRKE